MTVIKRCAALFTIHYSLFTKWVVGAALFTIHYSLLTSCSEDWDSHYEDTSTGSATLWQAIEANGDLSNFASVARAAGFDRILAGDQTFTVFAPTNSALSATEAQALIAEYNEQANRGVRTIDNTVVRRFLQNHIALYRHPVSSLTNETLTLMNDKYAQLTASKLANNELLTKNTLCSNGQLFTLAAKLDYVPNVFEAIDMTEGLDSVYQFLASHNSYEFNEAQSVPGEIINGVTHYLDSVTILHNDLLSTYGLINCEDSSYWFVAPTNEVWNQLVEEYTPYFNYPNTVSGRDSMAYTNARVAIICGAFFSRTRNPETAFADSAVSTQAPTRTMRTTLNIEGNYYVYKRPFEEGGIFYATEDFTCSNGHMRKASTWNFSQYDTFVQNVSVEAENTANLDTLINAVEPLNIVQVASNNAFYNEVSSAAYVEVIPTNPSAKVAVGFKIPNLLSGLRYNIYAVFAPATAGDPLATAETEKDVRVLSRIRQSDMNGNISSPPFRYPKNIDGTKVDEVLLQSNVKLNTCSWGLSTPTVRLELQSNTEGATLRIDRIIFRPVKQ